MAAVNVSLMDFAEDELESFLSGRSSEGARTTTVTGLELLADVAVAENGAGDGVDLSSQDGDGQNGVVDGGGAL